MCPLGPPGAPPPAPFTSLVPRCTQDKHVPKTRRHRGAEEGELHATKRRADAPLDCGQSSKPRVGEGGEPPEAPAQPPPQPGGASGGHLSDGELPDEEAPRHDEGRSAPSAEAARPRGGASSSGPPPCHAPRADAAPARQLPGGPARHHGLQRAAPPKERQRHDKPGNVVFCRAELPHRPLVSEGSRNGAQSKSHLGTQKTVFARPLLGESALVESHPLSHLESLKERLPAMYDEWCRTKSESACRLIARCVKKQHERARGMQTPQQTCEHLMPGQWGQWLHALAFE